MKYFQMKFADFNRASSELWAQQRAARKPLTKLSVSAEGSATSVWTQDPESERQFRQVLQELGIEFTESDEQQVKTWLDDVFG